jgi:hypothetical protein
MRKFVGTILLSVVVPLIFLASRWVLVDNNSGDAFRYGEELIYPTIAVERLRGNPFVDGMMYQDYTSGGYLLQSYLAEPFVKRPVCTARFLNWLPILFSFAGFLIYLFMAWKFLGYLAASIFSILMILGTPLFLELQTIGYANHNESHIFIAPCLFALFWLLFGKSHNRILLAAVSFFCGFWCVVGIGYCYTAMVAAIFLILLAPFALFTLTRKRQFGWWGLLAVPLVIAGAALGNGIMEIARRGISHPNFGYYSLNASNGLAQAANGFIHTIFDKARDAGNWKQFLAVIIKLPFFHWSTANVMFWLIIVFFAMAASFLFAKNISPPFLCIQSIG